MKCDKELWKKKEKDFYTTFAELHGFKQRFNNECAERKYYEIEYY